MLPRKYRKYFISQLPWYIHTVHVPYSAPIETIHIEMEHLKSVIEKSNWYERCRCQRLLHKNCIENPLPSEDEVRKIESNLIFVKYNQARPSVCGSLILFFTLILFIFFWSRLLQQMQTEQWWRPTHPITDTEKFFLLILPGKSFGALKLMCYLFNIPSQW